MNSLKTTIGRNVYVDLIGHAAQIPAKVDTGADSSSIWASNVSILPDGTLQFTLFDSGSPFYDGKKLVTSDFSVASVRNSTGHTEIRYRAALSVRIKGRRIKATFNLSDRSRNHFPILIGRRTLSGKFIVDVSERDDANEMKPKNTMTLNKELSDNPQAFYKKYHSHDQ